MVPGLLRHRFAGKGFKSFLPVWFRPEPLPLLKKYFPAFLLVLFVLNPVRLFAWEIERLYVEAEVRPDGTAVIRENFRVNFGFEEKHGIYRDIPVSYRGPMGENFKMRLNVLGVTDESAMPWAYSLQKEGPYLRIRIGQESVLVTGVQNYRIVYEVSRGAVRFFQDHDEFYWNLTGNEWAVPMREVRAAVRSPHGIKPLEAVAFRGAYGAAGKVDAELSNGDILLEPEGIFQPREGLTVAVKWAKGIFREPSKFEKCRWFFEDNWAVFIPFLTFAAMMWLWIKKGRDPRLKKSLMVEYAPPENMSPAEMGALLDEKADLKDITATIVNLAVKGYIRIENKSPKPGSQDYELTALKPWTGDLSLKMHEQRIMESIFIAPRIPVRLDELKNSFYKKLPGIRSKIYQDLVYRKWFDSDPESVRTLYFSAAFIIPVFMILIFYFLPQTRYFPDNGFVLNAVVCGIIIAVFSPFMPRRTISGAQAAGKILGFREFLKRVDQDRIRRIQDPSLFEKGLPYAMAFGVAGNWARAFEGIYTQPPSWYSGYGYGNSFSTRGFERDLNQASSSMNQVFTSMPSSSSSGFGGGGFSGGGGGGGGGGSW